MKKTRIFAGLMAAAVAATAMTAAVSAYSLGDKPLGKNWSLNVTIPAEAFEDLTADNYVTITFTPDADEQEYWSIKPMDSSWAFIDENGVGGPELAEGKDAYPVQYDWTSISFKVSADYLDAIKESGMIIIGHSLVLHELTITDGVVEEHASLASYDADDDGAADETPSEETPTEETPSDEAPSTATGNTAAATTDKTNADTGVEGVAAFAGVALVAAAAVAISRKRK